MIFENVRQPIFRPFLKVAPCKISTILCAPFSFQFVFLVKNGHFSLFLAYFSGFSAITGRRRLFFENVPHPIFRTTKKVAPCQILEKLSARYFFYEHS